MKYLIILGMSFMLTLNASYARDYLGMEPKIIDAKKIEGVTNPEGETIKILLGTEDTAGQYTLFSDEFADITSIPMHKHDWHDEVFYVIRGKYEVINGDENNKTLVDEDSVVFTPRGTTHAWKALEPNSKILVFYTPGGWEHFFEAVIKLTPEQREDKAFMAEFLNSYDEHIFQ